LTMSSASLFRAMSLAVTKKIKTLHCTVVDRKSARAGSVYRNN
jgi:hypothetical protein